jgi:sugar phosphate isomerase/epimerase
MTGTALGLQLYTMRHANEPLLELLHGVAAAGYAGVETVGTQGVAPERLGEMLAEAGLALASAHLPLAELRRDPDAAVAAHLVLATPLLVVPWLAPADRPLDGVGWTALGRELDALGARLAADGLRLAYHHHDFELERGPDDATGLARLLAAADPAHLGLELDTGWLVTSGEDPLAWLDDWGPRVLRLHLKDVDRAATPPWVDVGDGVLDGPAILTKAREHGVPWCLVEHDAPADPWTTARRSAVAAARWLAGP